MNCQQFEARLNELLDERAPLELDGALEVHHQACAPCRGLWSAYAQMNGAMRFQPLPQPRRDLAERIVAAASRETVLAELASDEELKLPNQKAAMVASRRKTTGRLVWRAAAVAVAAAMLVAVCWKFEPPVPRTGAPTGGLADQGAAAGGQRGLSELAQDAAQRYAGLARETRSDLSDVLALVPQVEGTPAAILWGTTDGRLPTPEVANHVREGLRPLADSTMAALTSLLGPTHREDLMPRESVMPHNKGLSRENGEL